MNFQQGLWLGLAGLAGLASSAQAAPPGAEAFFRDPDIVDAVLSPSGRKLAITSAKGVKRVGLAVLDLAPGGKLVRTAQYDDADITAVHWVNDERLVFSATDYAEGGGLRTGAPGLFAVNADGSQQRQLVRRQGTPFVSTGDRQTPLLDWKHRLLRVPQPQPGQLNERVLLAELLLDDVGSKFPIWVNTRTGQTESAAFRAPGHAVHWLTDSVGNARAIITVESGRQAAYWRPPGSTQWTQLYETGLFDAPFLLNSVDDAGTLYVSQHEGPDGLSVLKRYDAALKATAAKPVVVTPGFDFHGGLLSAPETGEILGVRTVVDGETTVWFNPAIKALQAEADRLLPGCINRIDCRRCGQADMVALVRAYSDHDPGRMLLYQAQPPEGDKRWRAIGRVNDSILPEQMASMELHRIKARDGRDLPVWVTRPDKAAGPLPTVVLVHGGPWLRGSAWGWHAWPQFLASRGYLVIEPEMRGSAGYGDAHFRAGFKQFGQAMQDDVADALRWAQGQQLASDKTCIAGASYGGYSTLMGLIKDPELYRCGVAWMALADLDLFLSGSWWVSDDLSNTGRRHTLPDMVGDATKDAAMIAANSPVKQAARIKAPLLLAFGEEDRRVPLAHGERLRKAMKAAGNDPVWVTYPGEGHGFGSVKNRVDFAQRVEVFLAKQLGGQLAAP